VGANHHLILLLEGELKFEWGQLSPIVNTLDPPMGIGNLTMFVGLGCLSNMPLDNLTM
jgi:hypothetical protein